VNYRKPQYVFAKDIDLAAERFDLASPWITTLEPLDARYDIQYPWHWGSVVMTNGTGVMEANHRSWIKIHRVQHANKEL
jgi:hypothetical protein